MSHLWIDPTLEAWWRAAYPPDFATKYPDYAAFSAWMPLRGPWEARVRHGVDAEPSDRVDEYPGVYLVAVFNGPVPGGPASPLDAALVYIGRTRTGTLRSRWESFRRSAEGRDRSHSGGNTFHDTLIRDEFDRQLLARTYIAGLPVWFRPAQPFTSFRTAVLEALLVDAVHRDRHARGLPDLLNKP